MKSIVTQLNRRFVGDACSHIALPAKLSHIGLGIVVGTPPLVRDLRRELQ
jgi:hypothetical protein